MAKPRGTIKRFRGNGKCHNGKKNRGAGSPSPRRTRHFRCGSAIPRHDMLGLCVDDSRLGNEGAGNAGCPMHPQPVCKGRKHTVVTTGSPVSAGIPCTMVLTAYSALLCLQNLAECANGRL